jgi:hypothetical protein
MQAQDFADAESDYLIYKKKAQQAIASVASTAAGQKQNAVASAEGELRDCDETLRQMASIAYNVPPTKKREMNTKIKAYRCTGIIQCVGECLVVMLVRDIVIADRCRAIIHLHFLLTTLPSFNLPLCRQELQQMKSDLDNAKRMELFASGRNVKNPVSDIGNQTNEQRIAASNSQLDNTTALLNEARRGVAETEEIAVATQQEMYNQREQLQNAHQKVVETGDYTEEAGTVLRNMGFRGKRVHVVVLLPSSAAPSSVAPFMACPLPVVPHVLLSHPSPLLSPPPAQPSRTRSSCGLSSCSSSVPTVLSYTFR